ncbi:hypothetical protein, variant [Exophiala xenobiotica]|uniref:Uncharacterized protein n=1 Tax=Exophiala xenobiotica TaxID=348802 RepID=A0A0D2E294_9EURO|nr:hypothetical protein, variant [Exophiala xenobiotica]XP_013310132.1 uncharacterized protein PV05_11219 [Exophiala xenobiotica]KIW49547.1 hypothetical protein PV05_11219 [Exophiala xenobiotica]KIW49548.1 hypothetical protein, variant [Exophiala xenobiotica]
MMVIIRVLTAEPDSRKYSIVGSLKTTSSLLNKNDTFLLGRRHCIVTQTLGPSGRPGSHSLFFRSLSIHLSLQGFKPQREWTYTAGVFDLDLNSPLVGTSARIRQAAMSGGTQIEHALALLDLEERQLLIERKKIELDRKRLATSPGHHYSEPCRSHRRHHQL